LSHGCRFIKRWRTGEYIEYEANADYWQGAPAIERFFIEIFPSTEALLAALETGETDIAWGLRSANIPKLEELGKTVGVSLIQTVPAGGERYVMNADASQAPIFTDKNVRLALQHAVDQDTIISDLLGGWAAVNPGTEWFGTPWAAPLERYAYDPDKSIEVLAGSGWIISIAL
jgi:peptide/nickel transport system substrate-binding protein